MEKKQPEKCEACNKKHYRLYYDHDAKAYICGKCWKETHNVEQIKMNWAAIGVAS